MLYIVIETFKGDDPVPVYRRFHERGRLAPDDLRYVASWVTADLTRCIQIMECEQPQLLVEWTSHWDDLVEFEIFPAVTSSEALEILKPRL